MCGTHLHVYYTLCIKYNLQVCIVCDTRLHTHCVTHACVSVCTYAAVTLKRVILGQMGLYRWGRRWAASRCFKILLEATFQIISCSLHLYFYIYFSKGDGYFIILLEHTFRIISISLYDIFLCICLFDLIFYTFCKGYGCYTVLVEHTFK